MKRTIAIISKDLLLNEACQEVERLKAEHQAAVAELQKKADDLGRALAPKLQAQHDKIMAHLEKSGLIGGFDKEKHHVCWNVEEDAISIHDNSDDEDPLLGFIRNFTRKQSAPKADRTDMN